MINYYEQLIKFVGARDPSAPLVPPPMLLHVARCVNF